MGTGVSVETVEIVYDAIVVGSGATGGVAAKTLSEQGLKVLVLEAGRNLDPNRDLSNDAVYMAKRFYNLSIARNHTFQGSHPGYWKTNPDFFANEKENPYTTPEDKPFFWIRGRQVGGKSLTWGGITLRLSDYEFKAASHDGYGQDWPIAYQDLVPYYDRLEQFFQVRGAQDGLDQLPDGHYLSPPALTSAELHLQALIEKTDSKRLIISRGFPFHKPSPSQPWSPASSQGSSLKAALATGNVTLRSDAVVSHVLFDPATRKARGVAYVDRVQKTTQEALGRVVVLCASAIESVRILLHSTEQDQPGGLVNESGLLGHYLMDHVSTSQFFRLPTFPPPRQLFPLSGSESFFIPRFCNLKGQDQDFLRGYGLWGGIQRFDLPGVLRKVSGGSIGFLIGHGEMLPRQENRVSLNRSLKDAWGIPVAHIDCAWSENEHRMLAHMRQEIADAIASLEGEPMNLTELFHFPVFGSFIERMEEIVAVIAPPGYYVHEVGGACMGTAPTNSVLNPYNQCWETPNLLVTDGACWTSAGWQSPTLTEMAITARACHYIVKEMRQGSA
jgi:choline dehydrogenase-like flavoprotein